VPFGWGHRIAGINGSRSIHLFRVSRFALTYPIFYQNVNNWSPDKYIDIKPKCAIQFSSHTGCTLSAISRKPFGLIHEQTRKIKSLHNLLLAGFDIRDR
jgi:hypothetical protein